VSGEAVPPERRLHDIADQIARLAAENDRLVSRLSDGERRIRLISRSILRVQESERGRIARELHDGLGQSLTVMKMQLDLLARDAARQCNPLAGTLLELAETAERALFEVRQVSHLLRPQMLDELGLAPTLRRLARTFETRTGVQVSLEHEGVEERLDPEAETLAYRVTQEALTNVAKHAGSAWARVCIRREGDLLRLRIEDGGGGFDPALAFAAAGAGQGFGLRGMRDRVALLGGQFDVRSAPGAGTTIEAEVPLEPRPREGEVTP
jgi:two-component system, NarL family, sensor kinase